MTWQWFAVPGVAVVAGLLFRRYAGFVTRALGQSMWPTLRPGEVLFTRPVLHPRQLRHGDIAVVRSAELGQRIVKRVVGLPGDHVVLVSGGLVRNGAAVAEPHVVRAGGKSGSWRVPEGHCFLLGDNRAVSSDSRCWREPFIPLNRVVGCASARRSRANGRRRSARAADLTNHATTT